MAGTPFPIPKSSTPGARAGEGEGRLFNCYAVTEGDRSYVRRVPGLAEHVDTTKSTPRGILNVNGAIYIVYSGAVVWVSGTTVTTLTGSIPGTDPVTLARNNKVTGGSSTPDIVAVRSSGGAYVITSTTVSAYNDADLPATVNSVDFQGGYFVFSIPDGRWFASELNSTAVNALSFTTAESRADALKRMVVHGNTVYAMGASTIEPYANVGTSPFAFQRSQSVIAVGTKTTMAVAGFEEGWDQSLYFVASDNTVRSLSGFDTQVVSTADVQRFVAASDAATLEVSVFNFKGQGFVAVSSSTGTWVYDVRAGSWHERGSTGTTRWRASRSIFAFDLWWLCDTLSGSLFVLQDIRTEKVSALGGFIQTGALKDFPANVAASLAADFTEAAITIYVSWSHDGGKTWCQNELQRSITDAEKWPVTVDSLGLSTHHGIIVKFRWEGSADFSFMGATANHIQSGSV